MSFPLYFAGLMLIASVAALVALPLLRPDRVRTDRPQQVNAPELERWQGQKRQAYAALKEAEFDLQTGKLTDEDYRALREKYEARALDAMAQLDRLERSQTARASES
ncbi:MAG: hypothetical protein J4F42_15270 [Desulfurellaceae bacterium]|nr:hypothetical protein [Desulfurellaceae bacterium]